MFEEKMSGKGLAVEEDSQKALSFLREKDVLIVESLINLGRNYDDNVQMVQILDRLGNRFNRIKLPIPTHDLGDPNLQKLIWNMIVQLLSLDHPK